MKNLLNYLSKEDICTIYESVYTYKQTHIWAHNASNLLKLACSIEPYMDEKTTQDRLLQAAQFDTFLKLYNSKILEENLQQSVENYMVNLPGFDPTTKYQNHTVFEQHGFRQMQLVRYINDISTDYKETVIFDPDWISTKEKESVVNQEFSTLFDEEKSIVLDVFNEFKNIGYITNFTLWDVLLKDISNTNLLSFICDVLNYNTSNRLFNYNIFIDNVKNKMEIINLKNSLSSSLKVKSENQVKKVSKL